MSLNLDIADFVSPDYGRRFPIKMRFRWATDVVSYGLTEQRNQLWSRPKRFWPIEWAAIKTSARAKLFELFNRAAGRFRTFYWLDGDDKSCGFSDWSYTAAGGETTVQLQKNYYPGEAESWTENKKAIVPGTIYAPTVKIDAATLTEGVEYTLDDTTGIINFAAGSAPNGALSASEVVTADYQFYFVVAYASDEFEDNRITLDLARPSFVLEEVVT